MNKPNFDCIIKSYVFFSLLMITCNVEAQNTTVKNKLYEKYRTLQEQDYYKMTAWRNSLPKDQKEELKNHINYMKIKSDDCDYAVRSANAQYSYASGLIYVANIDFPFFQKCKLVYTMQSKARDTEKEEALKILKKIADRGEASAQFYYAMNHSWEYGGFGFTKLKIKKDMNVFFNYMKKAHGNGDITAASKLIYGYEHIKDYQKALNWINTAIVEEKYDSNKDTYYWKKGNYYLEGKGVDKNQSKAYNNFKKAADLDKNFLYTFMFGKMLYEGQNGFTSYKNEGVKYLRKAAKSQKSSSAEKYCRKFNISY